MRDGSYAESEAYDPASVLPIHIRSELSFDSDSAYDSASVASGASVNQPLKVLSKKKVNKIGQKRKSCVKPRSKRGECCFVFVGLKSCFESFVLYRK